MMDKLKVICIHMDYRGWFIVIGSTYEHLIKMVVREPLALELLVKEADASNTYQSLDDLDEEHILKLFYYKDVMLIQKSALAFLAGRDGSYHDCESCRCRFLCHSDELVFKTAIYKFETIASKL